MRKLMEEGAKVEFKNEVRGFPAFVFEVRFVGRRRQVFYVSSIVLIFDQNQCLNLVN